MILVIVLCLVAEEATVSIWCLFALSTQKVSIISDLVINYKLARLFVGMCVCVRARASAGLRACVCMCVCVRVCVRACVLIQGSFVNNHPRKLTITRCQFLLKAARVELFNPDTDRSHVKYMTDGGLDSETNPTNTKFELRTRYRGDNTVCYTLYGGLIDINPRSKGNIQNLMTNLPELVASWSAWIIICRGLSGRIITLIHTDRYYFFPQSMLIFR